jgi:hypothetical protein
VRSLSLYMGRLGTGKRGRGGRLSSFYLDVRCFWFMIVLGGRFATFVFLTFVLIIFVSSSRVLYFKNNRE